MNKSRFSADNLNFLKYVNELSSLNPQKLWIF